MTRYSRGAAILGSNRVFRDFLTQTRDRPVPDAAAAAEEVRRECQVSSRRELDVCQEAGRRYLALVEEFNNWFGERHG